MNTQVATDSPIGRLMATINKGENSYRYAKAIYQHRAGNKNWNSDYSKLTNQELEMITKWQDGLSIPPFTTSLTLDSVSPLPSTNDNEIPSFGSPLDSTTSEIDQNGLTGSGRPRIHQTAYDRLKAYRERQKFSTAA